MCRCAAQVIEFDFAPSAQQQAQLQHSAAMKVQRQWRSWSAGRQPPAAAAAGARLETPAKPAQELESAEVQGGWAERGEGRLREEQPTSAVPRLQLGGAPSLADAWQGGSAAEGIMHASGAHQTDPGAGLPFRRARAGSIMAGSIMPPPAAAAWPDPPLAMQLGGGQQHGEVPTPRLGGW